MKSAMKNALLMVHERDPAEEIIESVGDLKGWKVFGNRVLVGVYLRPEKTMSGIWLTDATRKEDEYQGCAGVVLKKGPLAFVDDAITDFAGLDVAVGDWVSFNVNDSRSRKINGVLCRIIPDNLIELAIPSPDLVY